ncbi:MAG TPA: DUF5320 domain-containing protein [Firmicutes bacterium]|nr:DUF5320 domain-containing protein [Bacillota bacterium]
MLRGRDIYGPGFWKGGPGVPGWMNCRLYPWLPRRWWAYVPAFAGTVGVPAWAPWWQGNVPQNEADFLRTQAEILRAELNDVEKRLSRIEGRSDEDRTSNK